VNSGSLSLPVSLSYHASGVRVNEYASWVGLGWSLNAGGVITRVMRGRPDDDPTVGYLDQISSLKSESSLSHHVQADVDFMTAVTDGVIDTEPDIFYFNFGEFSGSFVFGADGNIYPVPYTPLKFNVQPNGFIVKTPNGVTYEFFGKEITLLNEGSITDFVSAWYLTKVSTPDQKDEILLTYKSHSFSAPSPKASSIAYYHSFNKPGHVTPEDLPNQPREINYDYNGSVIQTAALKLESIQWNRGYQRIDFISSGDRLDLASELKLDEVKIQSKSCSSCNMELLKKYQLSYSYNSLRLFLQSVKEVSPQGVDNEPYTFEYYYPTGSIDYFTNAQDHWGFYNAKSNSDLIPKTTFFSFDGSPPIELGNADRSPHPTHSRTFSLQKINYPTKGYTLFEFESNKIIGQEPVYSTTVYNSLTNISAAVYMNEKTVTMPQSSIAQIEILANFASSPQLLEYFTQTGTELKCASQIVISNLTRGWTLSLPTNSDPDGTFQTLLDLNIYPVLGGDQIRLFVDVDGRCYYPNGFSFNLDASVSLYARVLTGTSPTEKVTGGIRVKEIKDHDYNDALIYHQSFLYEGAKQIYYPRYDYELNFYLTVPEGVYGGGCTNVSYKSYLLRDVSIVSLGSGSGSPIVYDKVTIAEKNGAASSGRKIFYYRNDSDIELNTPQFSLTSSMAWRRGLLIKEETFKEGESNPLQIIEYNYLDSAISQTRGLKIAKNGNFVGGYCGYNDYAFRLPFTYRDYFHFSFWQYLSSKTTKVYSALNELTVTERFSYDRLQNFQVKRVVKNTSSGDEVVETFMYPHDLDLSNPYRQRFIELHQIGEIINYSKIRNKGGIGNLLEQTIRNYKLINNTPVLASIDKKFGSEIVKEIEFKKFNTNNRVLEYESKDGLKTALLWSENDSFIIAQIKNSLHENTYYNSFENDSGTLGLSRTGKRYFNGTTFTIPVSARPIGSDLRMTFWYYDGVWKLQSEVPYAPIISKPGASRYDEIRVYPSGAHMTTYTHDLGFGVTSTTDANNKTTFYDYDSFSRLNQVKDSDRNILQRYEYNYIKNGN
jgi:YD repeat-containing protein